MISPLTSLLFIQLLINCFEIQADDSFRLPTAIVPFRYKIHAKPDFYDKEPKDFVLYGQTSIYAVVMANTETIKVHAVNLTLTDAIEVVRKNENLFSSKTYDIERQWFVLRLKTQVRKGDIIEINFLGYKRPILHSLYGIYYYTRTLPNEKVQYGVTTQGQPTGARHIFPCFDEPQLKSSYEISISRKSNYFSLSNSRLMSSQKNQESNDWIVDKFAFTPIMSTYLVTIIVTQYKGISESIRAINFTIYYPPGKTLQNLALPMKVVKMTYPVLEEYFDFSLPLSKLDQIGFQRSDYEKGGMENFGMITYRDLFIYADPKNSKYHPYLSSLIVHELVHQWFGNIVTMKWWDDLWLNEGLSEYFSLIRGKWQLKKFQTRLIGERYILRTMDLEINDVIAPVYFSPVNTPVEIKNVGNEVTYKKGAMVMQLAELLLGEKTFRNGLRVYIKRHAFKSVTHRDLWNALQTTAQEDGIQLNITKLLTPWIKQIGFPVVNVKIDYKARKIDFSQELFAHSVKDVESSIPIPNEYNYTWPLPIQWKTRRGKSNIHVRFTKKGSVKIPEELDEDDWLVVNPEAHFYYIVNYEREHWELLGQHLKKNHTSVDIYTRVKLIFDVVRLFSSTKQGKGNFIDAATVIKVLQFAKHERNEIALRYLTEVKKYGTPELQPIIDLIS